MTEAIVNKQSSTIINEESQKKLYTVIVYYGGQFVHIPIFSYTANTRKIYHNVDLEELSVQELKVCFGDILGEFDSLYYNVLSGIRLLTMTTKDEVIEMSKQFDNTATLYVYHQTPAEWDDDIDNFREDDAYSDYEFNEIRKATQEERLRINAFEKDYYINNGSGSESYTSGNSDYEGVSSEEESDRVVCYATPEAMKFMPTPGMRNFRSHVTSSTPPMSTPPMSFPQNRKQAFTQQSHMPITKNASGSVSKNVKKFTAPRKIKK